MAGYHVAEIEKGELGQASKIREEFEEFMDAHNQNVKIMELVELSDLIGAIEHYVHDNFYISLDDLIRMKKVTSRAFTSGYRESK